MATVAIQGQAAERRFYSGMALFMALLVLIGFSASFYLRGIVAFPRPNPSFTPLIWLHGIVFTTWMLLIIAQTQLVAAGRRDVHMALGIAGMLLAVAMIPIMFFTGAAQVARATQPPDITPLAWTALPFFGIPLFAYFIWMGWSRRREAQVHKRFMLLAGLLMLEPAIGRMPIFPPSLGLLGHNLSAFLGWLPVVALFVWDWRSRGRLHWVTLTGAGLMALMLIVRQSVWQTAAWESFAARLVALAG